MNNNAIAQTTMCLCLPSTDGSKNPQRTIARQEEVVSIPILPSHRPSYQWLPACMSSATTLQAGASTPMCGSTYCGFCAGRHGQGAPEIVMSLSGVVLLLQIKLQMACIFLWWRKYQCVASETASAPASSAMHNNLSCE